MVMDGCYIRRHTGNNMDSRRHDAARDKAGIGRRTSTVTIDAATATAKAVEEEVSAYESGVPLWLKAIDTAAIALLNVTLAIEVVVVFANTLVRTLFNSSALMGADETSPLFLVTLAFVGGA